MSKIEEVARAMWEERRRFVFESDGVELDHWGEGTVPRDNNIMGEALAALRAIREPDEGMLESAKPYGLCMQALSEAFETMIDSIIAEEASKHAGKP